MAKRLRFVIGTLFVLVVAVGLATPAQERPADQSAPEAPQTADAPPQPTFRTGIDFVRVDVIVTDDDGAPVLDLDHAEFEILEDGEPQKIETFRLVQVSGELEIGEQAPRRIRSLYDEESEAGRDDVRVFVIFLDDYHVRRGNDLSVREPLAEFITQQLGPRDLLGVMYPLTPLSDVRLTRNRGAILRTVDSFLGRKWDYEPKNQFEYQYAEAPSEIVERIRNEVSLSALGALATHLGGLREGRKSIIAVSEGYANTLPPQLRDQNASLPGYRNPNRLNPFAGVDDSYEATYRAFNELDLNRELRETFNAANRHNTSLYMLDPRGLTTFEFDMDRNINFTTDSDYLRLTQDTLHVLAEETDGRAIVNQNDLAGGLRQMVADSSAYYLLGYTSAESPSDGKFHKIEVRVDGRDVKLRARRGYWALTAEARVAATTPAAAGPPSDVMTALASLARPPGGRTVDTWIGTARGDDGRTRVTFVWAPSTSGGAGRSSASAVSLTASGSGASPYFRGDVRNGTDATARGPGHRVVFEADPGELLMRVSVEGRDGDLIDRDVQDLDLPDFSAPEVALSTPVVLRATGPLEYRALRDAVDAVPSVGREFRRTDRLLIRFRAYAPGDSQPALQVELLNRAGESMSTLPTTAQAGVEGVNQVDLPLAGLAPSQYLIAITASTPEGEAKELIAFTLTS